MPPIFDWLFGSREPPLENPYAVRERRRLENVFSALDGPYGDNATLYNSTKALLEAATLPSNESFARTTIIKLVERCEELRVPTPYYDIAINMLGATAGLYAAEFFDRLPPNPALYANQGDTAVLGMMRDRLLQLQRKLAAADRTIVVLSNVLVESFLAIARRLPSIAQENPSGDVTPNDGTTMPLIDVLPDVGSMIEAALQPFESPEADDIGLFRYLKERLNRNRELLASKARPSRPMLPSEYSGTPRELVSAYLRETPLERIFLESRILFTIPISKRLEHTAIIAGSGWGKTQLLQTMIARDLETADPPAMVVIDSTNQMIQRIQRLDIFRDRLKQRIVIIDPERSPSPALNMFDVRSLRMERYSADMRDQVQADIIALFNYVFSSNQNPLTDPMKTVFSYMVRLLITVPGASITTLRKLLEDTPKAGYSASAFGEYIEKLDQTAQDFFRVQFYSERVRATRDSILQRLSSVISVPAFERMFSTINKIDFFEEMQSGSCILVNTSEAMLKDASPLFGRYIIARVMAAAFERASIPQDRRKPIFLIVDEAAPYFDDTFEKLLTRLRQFKLGVVIAFQHLEQASDKLRSAIASNTSIKYAGGLGYNDSRWLAREMRTTPENLLALRKDNADPPQFTNYACYVRGMDTAVNLNVPFYTLENMPMMSDLEHAQLLQRNKDRTSFTPPPVVDPSVPPSSPSPTSPFAAISAAAELSDTTAKNQSPSNDPGEPSDSW